MNTSETLLVLAGIPLATILVTGLMTVVPNRAKARSRYTPGDQWNYSNRLWAGSEPVVVPATIVNSQNGGARGTW
ncbi:hypothetical protein EH165_09290 [Nakamurella antarctica]|uniref:Uncharacterized protein n=1 Tax=Nakamurella antarctica TaxID=1902245 RepID=A0A3G8ZM11_9ACTN|nr:hypothetical protein [Nakamurella antarctica]AZI58303.1 hypothetical protein EH165_09290 [Nakamurella antarctica]